MLPALRTSRWLALKHEWPVRWAHHPLCSRHRHETWRWGRLHVCRGCLNMAGGLLGGTLAVWIVGTAWCVWTAAGLIAPVLLLSWPPRYQHLPRALRDLLRFALGLLIVSGTAALALHPLTAVPAFALLSLIWWWFRRSRVRVQARRCDGCPELGAGICSGYRLHAQAARAISAELEDRLLAAMAQRGNAPDLGRHQSVDPPDHLARS
jgi:hypothetical protein